jgi:DNA-binding NtrC family response regulator
MPPVKAALTGLHVLLLEDEALLARRLGAVLRQHGAEVTAVTTVREAAQLAHAGSFDLALLDVNLPDGRGTDLLQPGAALTQGTVVVMMTAEGGVAGAVEALKLGAADYLAKPFDPDELPLRLARAWKEKRRARAEDFRAAAPDGRRASGGELFFGPSLRMVEEHVQRILAADRQRTDTPPPVLIEGETGTGKTTIARWLHRAGPRARGPLIEINCSALPEALAESELFGHERGAFTDASTTRIGLMEAAEGGTLFLDEIPSLALPTQAKLLSALEDRVIRRVGSNRTRPIDVRIIAASNADLRAGVRTGRFRADLLQRLDLFRVQLPPLRERPEDLLPLAQRLAEKIAAKYGRTAPAIPPEGAARLRAHRWPGNVRELAHEIERALVFQPEDGLRFRALAPEAGGPGAGWLNDSFQFPPEGFSLEDAIDTLIRRALTQAGGNVSAAARLLGVSRDYVRYRLKDDSPPDPAVG